MIESRTKIVQPDFQPLRSTMGRLVEEDILPGISCAILSGREPVEIYCTGWADREAGVRLRQDHVFRVYSNTKLVTSMAVLLLFEDGRFALDDAIGHFIPELAGRRVLRRGATSLDQTEPAARPITIRHLLTHMSGLSYGLSDDGRLISRAYGERKVIDLEATLAEMMGVLAGLPLAFQPGAAWEYSVASDVLARLVEVISGERFDTFLWRRIFQPLGMVDTGFADPAPGRLVAFYGNADPANPSKPGLRRMDAPYVARTGRPNRWLNGGGGLFSTLPDMIALIRSLLPGGPTLLKPATVRLAMTNQLPEGVTIGVPGRGHGLLGAVVIEPAPGDPVESRNEVYWGGMAGTQWWISPDGNSAGIIMAQRHLSFDLPFVAHIKRLAYAALGQRWCVRAAFEPDHPKEENLNPKRSPQTLAPPTLDLRGKRALVTAGASGIGRAIAETLAASGAKVHITDISQTDIDTVISGASNLTGTAGDASDLDHVDRTCDDVVTRYGGLDLLVNNVGIAGPTGAVDVITDEDVARTFDVNLRAHFHFLRRFVPLLRVSTADPSIIAISSVAGRLGYPRRTPYAATKWGIIGLVKSLAVELGPVGIRVNAIMPGPVDGPRMDDVIENFAREAGTSPATVREDFLRKASLRRMVKARDIANLALFLASDLASSISGQAISVDANVEYL